MLKRLGVVLLWILATIGTASLTYAAVTRADRAVGDTPSGPVAGADIAARISTTTSTVGADSTVPEPSTTTSTLPQAAPSTTTTVATATTTGSSPPTTLASGPTTTAASSTEWKTVPGVGTVGVTVSGSTVTLASATPVAPYHVDVEDDGPEKVDVKFESEGLEYRVRAEVSGGQLVWQVTQSSDDGGDD